MKDVYVQAAHYYLDAGMEPAALTTALTRVMEKRGHEQLLTTVLKTLVRERSASRAIRTIVRVSNHTNYETLRDKIEASLKQLDASHEPTVVVDPTLIGGYQIEANGTRTDASHKALLLNLYRNITHATTN